MAEKLGAWLMGLLFMVTPSFVSALSWPKQERLAQGWFAQGQFYRARTAYWRLYHYSLSAQGEAMLHLRLRSQRRLHQLAFRAGDQKAYMAMANGWQRLRLFGKAPLLEFGWYRDLALMKLWRGDYASAQGSFAQLERRCRKGRDYSPGANLCMPEDESLIRMGQEAARDLVLWTKPKTGGYWQERHSPWFSALLSFFFPGLGQMYNDEWRLGVLSTVTVGGLGGLSYWAYHNKRRVSGSLFLYLALVYHSHNINRAMASAERYNQNLIDDKREGYFVRLRRRVSWLP